MKIVGDIKTNNSNSLFQRSHFINCVFKDDILSRDHRYFEYSYNPGSRHDITLDLEKKKKGPDGKYVKDENVTQDEKDELLDALVRLDDVGWAGATPHGVHCGIYFDKWTPIAHSRCIVGWFKDQLTRVAGYKGPLVIDPSPSVNCNRPSRYLSKLAFFRPERVLETDPVIAKNFKPVELDYSLSPSKDLPDRVKALKCRYNMMDSEETAAIVGKTVVWVEDLWDNVKQKFFNPFNQDIGQVVGPKTKEGRIIMNLKAKKRLYLNAAWSWQVCWNKGMDAMAAIAHVFNRPDFEEILGLLEQAYYESCQRNQGLPEYKNWREWVEADIERCCFKFRNGQPPQPLNRLAVKKAAVYICAHSAKNTVQVSAVAKKAGKSRVTTRKTFEMYNLKSHGTGKGKSYEVPAEWLADQDLNDNQKVNIEDPPQEPYVLTRKLGLKI